MKKIVIAYVPGLHEGYLRFFKKHNNADGLYVLGRDIIKGFRPLVKDIRAMDPEMVKTAIESFKIFPIVDILENGNLSPAIFSVESVVMPDEGECREFAGSRMPSVKVVFDPVFLRWDMGQTLAHNEPVADGTVSKKEFDVWAMGLAAGYSEKSS